MSAGRRGDEPMRLGDSLQRRGAVAARPDDRRTRAGADGRQMGGVFGRWDEAVGDAVAAHVQPVKLDGTTLVVEVDDPAWATQLRFLEAHAASSVCSRSPAPPIETHRGARRNVAEARHSV